MSQTAQPSPSSPTLILPVTTPGSHSQLPRGRPTKANGRVFGSWCVDCGVEASPAFPASVAASWPPWLSVDCGLRRSPDGVPAVRHYHHLTGVDPLPTDAAIVKTTFKGLRRSLGAAQAKKTSISPLPGACTIAISSRPPNLARSLPSLNWTQAAGSSWATALYGYVLTPQLTRM
jgi:hypothetical protein